MRVEYLVLHAETRLDAVSFENFSPTLIGNFLFSLLHSGKGTNILLLGELDSLGIVLLVQVHCRADGDILATD